MNKQVTVYLCDYDEESRLGMSSLLRQFGYNVRAFACGQAMLDYLDSEPHPLRAVFILDLFSPPLHGEDLYDQLLARSYAKCCPVIFISECENVPAAVSVVSKRTIAFLEKDDIEEIIMQVLERAIALEALWYAAANSNDPTKYYWYSLTPLQRKVVMLIEKGYRNAEIADQMHFSERAVESYRDKAFEALGVSTRVELAVSIAALRAAGIDVDAGESHTGYWQ